MRRIFLSVLFLILVTSPAMAEWGIQQVNPGTGIVKGNYASFGVLFTSDGNALSATDIIARIGNMTLKSNVQGRTLYAINVSPGTDAAAPNAAFTLAITNDWDKSLVSLASIDHSADSWPDITEDMALYPPILNELNIALGDIGDAGDQVTVYFYFWIEPMGN